MNEFGSRLPTEEERKNAAALASILERRMQHGGCISLMVGAGRGFPGMVNLPPALAEAVHGFMAAVAGGSGVMFAPFGSEMSVGFAADILNVDEKFVRKLGDEGEIEIVRPGMRPRAKTESVFAYKWRRDAAREKALDSLMASGPDI